MAETGIKISNLPQIPSISDNDYMIIVHAENGITYRTDVSKLQSQINPSSSNVNGRITALEKNTEAISAETTAISSEMSTLSNNFLSSSYKNTILNIDRLVNGDQYGNQVIKTSLDITNARFQILSGYLSNLVNNADIIDNFINVLTSESGEVSLTAITEKVSKNERHIQELQTKVSDISESAAQTDALVKDSILDFNNTRLNNVPTIVSAGERDFNPIDIYGIEFLSSSYNFYHDKNRFANVPQPDPITYMISGNASYYDETGYVYTEPSATYFESTSAITETYLSTDAISVVNCYPVSGEGISADHNLNPAEYVSVVLSLDNDVLSIISYSELPYPGLATFDVDAGIPLRYGMMELISSGNEEEDNLKIVEAIARLNVIKNSDVKIFLNKSSFMHPANIGDSYKSIIALKINGKSVSKKMSKADAIEADYDLEQAFDARLSAGSNIEFSITKLLSNDSIVDLSATNVTQESVYSDSLFGMVLPLLCPSQAEPIEFEDFKIDSVSENDDGMTEFGISIKIKGGAIGQTVQLSPYYSSNQDNLSSLAYAIENATPIDTTDKELKNYAINNYSLTQSTDETIYIRLFAMSDGIMISSDVLECFVKS